MSQSLRLARYLACEMRNVHIETTKGKSYAVVGDLDIGSAIVALRIVVPWRFCLVRHRPPSVTCTESWMRKGPEWHNDSEMCWVIPDEWREAMSWNGKPFQWILEDARTWLFTNVRSLISRHHYAELVKLNEWPAEWRFWGHGAEGIRQYRTERAHLQLDRLLSGLAIGGLQSDQVVGSIEHSSRL